MMDKLKEMVKGGIFNLLPNDGLSTIITSAKDVADVIPKSDDIEMYLRNLSQQLENEHNIALSRSISSFYDKFSSEMYDMKFTCTNSSNGIYQKDISYRDAGTFSFGIDMCSSTFTLEEIKLLKLINHYYIALSNKDNFKDTYIFIPFSSLRIIFPKVNNVKLKSKIVETYSLINSKNVYWDFSKTRYSKNLSEKKLCTGKHEKITDITALYLFKNTKSGYVAEMKGIVCKISNFMKLRFELKQISNNFPTDNLKCNYLGFLIAEKIQYQLHLRMKKKKKATISTTTYLRNLVKEMYVYKNGKQCNKTYLYHIMNDANSKVSILKLLESIIIVLSNLSSTMNFDSYLKVQNKNIDLTNYIQGMKDGAVSANKLYKSILDEHGKFIKKDRVRYLINAGEISLIINIKCTN